MLVHHENVELAHEDLVIRAITRHDLDDDVRGINARLDLIRRTRGGRWPSEPVMAPPAPVGRAAALRR
jgi:hypothetical protein